MNMTDDEKAGLEQEFRSASSDWASKIVQPDDPFPDLFHYTNAAGLLGILTSGSLWATDYRCLNDSSEMRYGMDLARSVLETSIGQSSGLKAGFLSRASELLEGAFEGTVPYVVSFSDHGQILSQWKEYGDGGAGFSIAFDLEQTSTLFGANTSVLKITYDPELQKDILSTTCEKCWKIFKESEPRCEGKFALGSSLEYTLEYHCRRQLISMLLTRFAGFKHPGFKEEREWRLLRPTCGESPLRFRTGHYGIVPFIEFTPPAGGMLPIKKISLGPTAGRRSAKTSVEMLLKERGYTGVEVDVCEVPVR